MKCGLGKIEVNFLDNSNVISINWLNSSCLVNTNFERMKIYLIDTVIIFAYLLIVIISGFLLSRRASKNMDSYFLDCKTVPWYSLGISITSGMFDISGTMWLVYMLFVYDLKGIWMPWMWPTFNQIFYDLSVNLGAALQCFNGCGMD